MRINNMKVCHLETPLGFSMRRPVFSWTVEESTGQKQKEARVQVSSDPSAEEILWDSGADPSLCSLAVPADLPLRPRTHYYWRVCVTADDGDSAWSEAAWFDVCHRSGSEAGK